MLGAAYATRSEQLSADSSDEARRIARIVGLAQHGTAVMFDDDQAAALVRFIGEAERRFGLKQDAVETLLASLEEETGEAAQMLSLELPTGVSYHGLVEQARTLMVSMSVEAMMRLDETSRTVAVLERENEDLQARPTPTASPACRTARCSTGSSSSRSRSACARTFPACLGVILIDVDRLGQFTEMLGHTAGDEVLAPSPPCCAVHARGRHARPLRPRALLRRRPARDAGHDPGRRPAAARGGRGAPDRPRRPRPVERHRQPRLRVPADQRPGDLGQADDRGDAQLYQAKRAGGNRVAVAFEPATACSTPTRRSASGRPFTAR